MTASPSHRHRRKPPRRRSRRSWRLATITRVTAICGALVSVAAYAVVDPERPDDVEPHPAEVLASPAAEDEGRAKPPGSPASSRPRIPTTGSEKFSVASGGSSRKGRAGTLIRYRVEVEVDLPFAVDDFARDVDRTLGDRRSWTKTGLHSFQRSRSGSLRIVLATPRTTDRLCAPLQTRGEVSCQNGSVVAINALRWARGARAYGQDIKRYRTYVINHEVGHSLGMSHAQCPRPAAKAPIMLQQTLGLDGCEANPWP